MRGKANKLDQRLRLSVELTPLQTMQYEILTCRWLRYVLKNWNTEWFVRYFANKSMHKHARYLRNKRAGTYARALQVVEEKEKDITL